MNGRYVKACKEKTEKEKNTKKYNLVFCLWDYMFEKKK